ASGCLGFGESTFCFSGRAEPASITADPPEETARLEDRIERLAARIESCRKFIVASRLAMTLGGILLVAMILQLILFDPLVMSASIVAVLRGIWPSRLPPDTAPGA